jgi:hypothetical protein
VRFFHNSALSVNFRQVQAMDVVTKLQANRSITMRLLVFRVIHLHATKDQAEARAAAEKRRAAAREAAERQAAHELEDAEAALAASCKVDEDAAAEAAAAHAAEEAVAAAVRAHDIELARRAQMAALAERRHEQLAKSRVEAAAARAAAQKQKEAAAAAVAESERKLLAELKKQDLAAIEAQLVADFEKLKQSNASAEERAVVVARAADDRAAAEKP